MKTAREFLTENRLKEFVGDPLVFDLAVKLTEAYSDLVAMETIDTIQKKLMQNK